MKITLLVAGKTREKYLIEGMNDYVKRIGHYIPFNIHVIPDIKRGKKTPEKMLKSIEGEKILQSLKPLDFVILLDIKGKGYASEKFAAKLASLEGKTGHTVFIIGGAYGFSDEVYARANEKLSLSQMTFSHQMVRLIFLEQLYRALTILKGEPYHHN